MGPGEQRRTEPSMAQLRVSRRSFLAASALATVGTAAGGRLIASQLAPADTGALSANQLATDPLAELAAALDFDVERIHRFVTDEIAYEPYAGGLRGPRGTLESRAGNSVDKASLLAALLAASLIETTFAEGRLDDTTAESVWSAWQADLATIRERADRVLTGVVTADGATVVRPGTSPVPTAALPPDARALVDRTAADADRVVALTSDLVDAGVRTIVDALAQRGVPIPADESGLPALERDRHVWVRARQGAEWLDLDPTLAGSEAGQPLTTAVASDLAAIPDDLRHRVELRVTVERIAGEGLEQEVILEHVAFADELAGLPIALSHERPEGLQGLGVGIDQMLTGALSYQPVLQVDDLLRIGVVGVALQGAQDDSLLGTLGSSERDGEATAEWLQVVTVAPDGSRDVADRMLFDRIGADARAAGPDVASIPPVELAPLTPGGPPEFAPARAIHFLAVATGATGPRVTQAIQDDDESAWPLHVVGHLYHMARDAAGSIIAPERGVRLFHDAPNVVRYTLQNMPGATDGSFDAAMDILHQRFRTGEVVGRPTPGASGVLAGVQSHAVERVVMGAEGTPADPAGDDALSVGGLIAAAEGMGVGIGATLPGDAIEGRGLSDLALRTLSAALTEGWVAIGPERPVLIRGTERIGWWLFDPATGRVIDRMDDGRGVAMVENALARYAAFLARHPYIKLGLCIGLTVKALHGLLEGMSGGNPGAFALATAGAAGALRRIACA